MRSLTTPAVRHAALLALGYAALAKASLLLAIPPANAAPVWPAAGLALLGVLAWGPSAAFGVVLGSATVNAIGYLEAGSIPVVQALAAAVAIGVGAALHALLGSWLVRRVVGWPCAMASPGEIGLLLLLGGPVACLASALVSSGGLELLGVLADGDLQQVALTWWAGDTIGVLALVPIAGLWRFQPGTSTRLRLSFALPPVVALGLTIVLFLVVTRQERQRIEFEFDRSADRVARAVHDGLGTHVEALRALRALYDASEQVTADEFRAFVERPLASSRDVRAFAWLPRVAARERSAFELGDVNGLGHPVLERAPDGRLVPARVRADFAPVLYVEPLAGNDRVLGFDALSEPKRGAAMRRAAAVDGPMATEPVKLVQDPHARPAIVVYLAIYQGGRAPADPAQRWAATRGFVAVSLDAPGVLARALAHEGDPAMDLELVPAGDGDDAPTAAPTLAVHAASAGGRAAFTALKPLALAGWPWLLRLESNEQFRSMRWSWQPWAALASGALFTGLIGAFLLTVAGRAAMVERVVMHRTEELRTVYHTVSHELKTPLAATRELVAIVHDGLAGPTTPDQRQFLALARDGVDTMAALVNDLTDVARLETGKIALTLEPVVVAQVLANVAGSLKHLAEEKGVLLEARPGDGGFVAQADERRLGQIVRNLVTNAVKFTPSGGRVELSVGRDPRKPGYLLVSVRDTGCGIAPENLPRVFDRLFQVREGDATAISAGMGLGLHLVRELVVLHGGEINVESEIGKGSVFSFTLVAGSARPSKRTPAPQGVGGVRG
jgi:signal transduction histidine kinase